MKAMAMSMRTGLTKNSFFATNTLFRKPQNMTGRKLAQQLSQTEQQTVQNTKSADTFEITANSAWGKANNPAAMNSLKVTVNEQDQTVDMALWGGKIYGEYSEEQALQDTQLQRTDQILDGTVIKGENGLPDITIVHDKAGLAGFDLALEQISGNSQEYETTTDTMASHYVAMKEKLQYLYSGEEYTQKLEQLNQVFEKHTQKLANAVADELGSFFSEEIAEQEKQKIKDGVLQGIQDRIAEYEQLVKQKPDYADIQRGDDALRENDLYLASELRKAMKSQTEPVQPNKDNAKSQNAYTADEISKLYDFKRELESAENYENGLGISPYQSEETLGIKLAQLVLKTKVFSEQSGVSDSLKQMMQKRVNRFVDESVEKMEQSLKEHIEMQTQAVKATAARGGISKEQMYQQIAEIKMNFAPMDKSIVYAIIGKTSEVFEKTGDVTQALYSGAMLAKSSFVQKSQSVSAQNINRYNGRFGDAEYWNSFFSANGTTNRWGSKQAGFAAMRDDWNDFIGKITDKENLLLKNKHFSAVA